MIVDLLDVGDRPVRFDFEIGRNQIDLDRTWARVVDDVKFRGNISRNSAQVEIEGALTAILEIDCTRCLTPTKREIDVPFRVAFVGKEMFPDARDLQLEGGDLDTDILEGNELDLKDVAREQVLLNLPEQAVCREGCRGLCPACGKDLNEGLCSCGEQDIDPRWSALKELNR